MMRAAQDIGAACRRKTSVLFVVPSLAGGGAERVVVTLLRHLDSTHFDLTLAVLDTRKSVYGLDVPPSVERVDLQVRRVRYALPTLLRTIRSRRPDVVFSVIGHLNLGMALLKPFLPRCTRLIARETNVMAAVTEYGWRKALWRAAYRFLYRRFDRIVCQSESMRRELVEDCGLQAGRLQLIRNPVDIARVRSLAAAPLAVDPWGPQTIRLVAAGRLSPEKGFDLLIDALGLLDDPRVQLGILGDGPLRDDLQARTAARGLTRQVHFLGFQANPYPYLARASAFVLSSRREAFPNVVLEALACGTPVIATPAPGGTLEILGRQQGCVVAREVSAKGLADAIAGYPFDASGPRVAPELAGYDAADIAAQYGALFDGTPA